MSPAEQGECRGPHLKEQKRTLRAPLNRLEENNAIIKYKIQNTMCPRLSVANTGAVPLWQFHCGSSTGAPS